MADEDNLSAYMKYDKTGQLTLHMAAHIAKFSPLTSGEISFEKIEKLRKDYKSENIRTQISPSYFLMELLQLYCLIFLSIHSSKWL